MMPIMMILWWCNTLKKARPPSASLRIPLASVKVSCKRRSLLALLPNVDDNDDADEEEEDDYRDDNDGGFGDVEDGDGDDIGWC